jgi:hypothetical protein
VGTASETVTSRNFCEECLSFLLARVIHDLGNSVGGILSLSDHHLRAGIGEPALEESLRLIYDSSQAARKLLLTVGEILHPASLEPEVVRLSELMSELEAILRLLLPRSLELVLIPSPGDGFVRVVRNQFTRHFLSLVSLDIGSERVNPGSISVGYRIEGHRARLQYDSAIRNNPRLGAQAIALFEDIVGSPEQMSCTQDDTNFSFAFYFSLWET